MKRVIGTKQVLKAIAAGEAGKVYIARDADDFLRGKLYQASNEKQIPIEWVDTMAQLGKLCGIAVGAAAAAELQH